MYVIVSPFKWSFDDNWLTYLVPEFLNISIKIWQIVEIPIKTSIEIWIVLDIISDTSYINDLKIKPIISIYDETEYLNLNQIKLVFWISKYYFTFIHNSLNLFFPKNLKEKILKKKVDNNNKTKLEYLFNDNIILSEKQSLVFKKINDSNINKHLLYWITWSWKTEIYINLIQTYLKQGKQSLLLIPEIILNNQIFSRLKKVFWNEILIINSSITDATKTKNWLSIYNNNAKIIIWTRSALFYPYNNLWIIIIDEEHDNSYKSDNSPRYSSIEVAEKITELNWNKLLLASWTPSIKSMYKWVKKDYNLISLLE
jgi:primosomal protein N' (replication factor Y)